MLKVERLYKSYGNHPALNGISFELSRNGVYGFLGPNGTGKSTTMNIITGYLAPSSGTVEVCGENVLTRPLYAKKHIGYLPEIPPVYEELTPEEYLHFVAEARGLSREEGRAQTEKALALTGLSTMRSRLIRQFSKGYRQRVGIAQAILGDPDVIILDEPMVGLDPLQIVEIRKLIRSLGDNHIVLLSSHILSEIQSICDRVIILSHGEIVADGTAEELERKYSGDVETILTTRAAPEEAEAILRSVSGTMRCELIKSGEDFATFRLHSAEDLSEKIFFAFAERRQAILELVKTCTSLETVFLRLTAEAESSREGEKQ